MDEHFGIADFRPYITASTPHLLSSTPHPSDLPYDMLLFRSDSTAAVTNTANIPVGGVGGGYFGFEGGVNQCGDGGAGRWPRQETLTLLEIRSRLDSKFKEASQKGPLWDEVSRIMCDEYGYQRSGKKCKEKFENLYKYYKKTKDGKAGRQNGKHYRFFRQLEALYGEPSNSASDTHVLGNNFTNYNGSTFGKDEFQASKVSDISLSLSNYSDGDTCSSDSASEDDYNDNDSKKRSGGWKAKIKDFINGEMKKLMDKQEVWMEKMMKTIEEKEVERKMREDEWRKQDAARVEREQKLWANERAWIEARDAALMEALHKLTGNGNGTTMGCEMWPEFEVARLIQLRTGMEEKFEQINGGGVCEEVLWEEIASKMACLGHENRNGLMCKEKWDSINNYLHKKRKENYYLQNHNEVISNHNTNNHGITNIAGTNGWSDGCFRYFMGDHQPYSRIM